MICGQFWCACVYCGDEVRYTVPADKMARFREVNESGDHAPVCASCDFYRQEDLLADMRDGRVLE
jgi:hypothetical protein